MFKSDIYYTREGMGFSYWRVFINYKTNTATIRREYGAVGHNSTISSRVIRVGKNLGKSNETTPYDQALKEVVREIKNKEKKGYVSSIDLGLKDPESYSLEDLKFELNDRLPEFKQTKDKVLKPMLAKGFSIGAFKYPGIIQPKINGVRCFAKFESVENDSLFPERKVVLRSKEGTIYNIDFISESIGKLLDNAKRILFEYYGFGNLSVNDLILDGELYIPFEKSTTIKGAASNKSNPLHQHLFLVIYDLAIPVGNQIERLGFLGDIFTSTPNDKINQLHCPASPVLLQSEIVNDDDAALKKANDYKLLGFEGGILRNPFGMYKYGKRVKDMLKLKFQQEAFFEIIDIIPQERYPDMGLAVCRNNDGSDSIFTCSINGTFDLRKEVLTKKHDYIGKSVKVGFFERTINNIPFHARVLNIKN